MKVFATLTTLLGVAYAAPTSNQMGYGVGQGANSLRQSSSSFSAAIKDVMGDKMTMEMYSSNNQMSPKDMRQMSDRQMSRKDMVGGQMSPMSSRQKQGQMDMSAQMDMSVQQMSGRQIDNRKMSKMDMSMHKMDRNKMSSRQMSSKNMPGHQMSGRQMSGHQMSGRQMSGHQQMSRNQMSRRPEQQMSFDYMNNALDSQSQGNQYYKQDKRGNYIYGYSSDVAEKFEEGNAETGVKGHYTFIDANGLSKRVDYIADKEGFRIIHDKDNNEGRFKRDASPDLVSTKMMSYKDMSLLRDDSQDMYRMNMGRDMMGHNNMMNQYSNMMGGDMSSNMNRMGQDLSSSMMRQNMMGQDVSTNMRNMYDMVHMSPYTDIRLLSNMMKNNNMMTPNNMMGSNTYNNVMNRDSNEGELLAQRDVMAQRMEVERIKDSLLNRMF